jgi:hypothetical protein
MKGDPRGTSFLLEQEQVAEETKNILSIRGDAELSDMIDWKKTLQKLGKARKIDLLPDDKITEKEEMRKKQPPPQDPAMAVAQLRVQGELQKVGVVQQSDMAELQFKAEQANLDRQHETQLKLMERDIEAMRLSAASGMSLDKIKAELTMTAQKLNTQVSLSHMEKAKAPQISEPPSEPAQHAPNGRAYQE